MRRVVILTLTVALALSIAAPVAIAQTNESTEEPNEVVLEVDSNVRVTDVEWGDTTATVTLASTTDAPQRVTISDISPINSAGAHQIEQQRVTLRDGETATVEIRLADPSNPQLSLATGDGAALLVGDDGEMSPFTGVPATWGLIRLGVLGAAGGGVFAIGLVGWSAVADRHDSDELVKP